MKERVNFGLVFVKLVEHGSSLSYSSKHVNVPSFNLHTTRHKVLVHILEHTVSCVPPHVLVHVM